MKPEQLIGKRGSRYIRTSTDYQEHQRQLVSTEKWFKQHQLNLTHTFQDDGSRHLSESREEFQKMLRAAEAKDLDFIVVDSLDRFGVADEAEFFYYIHLLRKWNNVSLWSVQEGCLSELDPTTLFKAMSGVMTSKREQLEKSWRAIEAKKLRAEQGRFCGGMIAYGLDQVCYGPDGKEKWRLVKTGRQQRTKYNADGTTETYNGKHNTPAYEKNDTLRLAPSILKERVEVVKEIFLAYADELISPHLIARRLNDRGVPSVYGELWNRKTVENMLRNPSYIGLPAQNKAVCGGFYEFKNGSIQLATPHDEDWRRSQDDWWQPDKPLFDPIIPLEVWERVQAKLRARTGTKSPPNPQRPAACWLQPFVYCAKCGKRMHSSLIRSKKYPQGRRYLQCSTYTQHGCTTNPSSCSSNCVKMDVVEGIVFAYLTDCCVKAQFDSAVNDATQKERYPLAKKHAELKGIQLTVAQDMLSWLHEELAAPVSDASMSEVVIAFEEAFTLRKRRVDALIAERQAKVDELYEYGKKLASGPLFDRSKKEAEDLCREIEQLRADLVPLHEKFQKVTRAIEELQPNIEAAINSLSSGNGRIKAEALSKIIDRIDLYFTRTEGPGRRKCVCDGITIHPVHPDQQLFDMNPKTWFHNPTNGAVVSLSAPKKPPLQRLQGEDDEAFELRCFSHLAIEGLKNLTNTKANAQT